MAKREDESAGIRKSNLRSGESMFSFQDRHGLAQLAALPHIELFDELPFGFPFCLSMLL